MLEMRTRTHANDLRPTDCETQTSRRMTDTSIYTTDHGWLRLLPPLFSIWLMHTVKLQECYQRMHFCQRDASIMLNNPPVIPFVNTPFTCRCRCLPMTMLHRKEYGFLVVTWYRNQRKKNIRMQSSLQWILMALSLVHRRCDSSFVLRKGNSFRWWVHNSLVKTGSKTN